MRLLKLIDSLVMGLIIAPSIALIGSISIIEFAENTDASFSLTEKLSFYIISILFIFISYPITVKQLYNQDEELIQE